MVAVVQLGMAILLSVWYSDRLFAVQSLWSVGFSTSRSDRSYAHDHPSEHVLRLRSVHRPLSLVVDDRQVADANQPRLFDAVAVLSKLSLDVSVLLTFGLSSPLLAVQVVSGMWTLLCRYKLLILRYLSLFGVNRQTIRDTDINRCYCIQRLEMCTYGSLEGLSAVMWLVVSVSGLFGAFLCLTW
jgi:hypothetical protein